MYAITTTTKTSSVIIMLSVSKTEGHKMGASTEVVFIDNGTDIESNR